MEATEFQPIQIKGMDKCAVIYRSDPFTFLYVCFHCGASFNDSECALLHVESHFHLAQATIIDASRLNSKCIETIISTNADLDIKKEFVENVNDYSGGIHRISYIREPELDIKTEVLDEEDRSWNLTETQQTFNCEHCGSSYSTKCLYRSHVLRQHYHQPILECKKCGKVFESDVNLEIHLEEHIERGEVDWQCAADGIGEPRAFSDEHVDRRGSSLIDAKVQLAREQSKNKSTNDDPLMDTDDEDDDDDIEILDKDDFALPMEYGEASNCAALADLPTKSKLKYMNAYQLFQKWRIKNGSRCISEDLMMEYFKELSIQNKPSSLWAKYSMLKTTVRLNDDINMASFHQLLGFLKAQSIGYKPIKAKVFSEAEIRKFIAEASDQQWLDVKVACIFAVSGAMRSDELVNLEIDNITSHGSDLLLVRIPKTRKKEARSFTIAGGFYAIVKKYAALRNKNTEGKRFFVNYQKGKCTCQFIGKNKMGQMPRKIATFLRLDEPDRYTGMSFRRTSTILKEQQCVDPEPPPILK